MAQIRIEDDVYSKLKEAAEFNKRTVGQHIAFLLDNEITFNEIRGMLAGQAPVTPVAPMPKVKKAKKLTLDDLTEKDLATAKVTFNERPDFKEPEKWDSHAWPTV